VVDDVVVEGEVIGTDLSVILSCDGVITGVGLATTTATGGVGAFTGVTFIKGFEDSTAVPFKAAWILLSEYCRVFRSSPNSASKVSRLCLSLTASFLAASSPD